MKRLSFGGLLSLVLLAAAVPAQAQVFTPTFQSPRLLNDVGIYLSDGPGDLAIEGIWRGGPLGIRAGFVDAAGGLLSIGGELRNPLAITGAPLGLAFTAAAQGLIGGDDNAVGLQAGLSAGYTFRPQGAAFTPYIHPRIGAVKRLGPDDDFSLHALADVGVDVEFWNNLVLRFGVSLDDIGSSWGVGLSIRQ
jgi:hypothetical protein